MGNKNDGLPLGSTGDREPEYGNWLWENLKFLSSSWWVSFFLRSSSSVALTPASSFALCFALRQSLLVLSKSLPEGKPFELLKA